MTATQPTAPLGSLPPLPTKFFSSMVIQAGRLCSANCTYCPLSSEMRRTSDVMSDQVIERVHTGFRELLSGSHLSIPQGKAIHVKFRGGEPLTVGIDWFRKFCEPIEDLLANEQVNLQVQTNGLALNEHWIELFRKYKIAVGISIDGPRDYNRARILWSGEQYFDQTMKAIALLHGHQYPFSIVSVISQEASKVEGFSGTTYYKFIAEEVRPWRVRLNIAMRKGAFGGGEQPPENVTLQFLKEVVGAYFADISAGHKPFVIDNIDRMVSLWRIPNAEKRFRQGLTPLIDVDGAVSSLSGDEPVSGSEYHKVGVVGSILEQSLVELINHAVISEAVEQFFQGTSGCRATCQYYGVCGGYEPDPRLQENGSLLEGKTNSCLLNVKVLYQALLAQNPE